MKKKRVKTRWADDEKFAKTIQRIIRENDTLFRMLAFAGKLKAAKKMKLGKQKKKRKPKKHQDKVKEETTV